MTAAPRSAIVAFLQRAVQITLNGGLLITACVAVFCLSVVGAICDDAKLESCLGNSTLHIIAAISFFVLYDAYLIILATTQTPPRQGRCCDRRHAAFAALVALSVATKARYGLSVGVEAQPWVAVFEWLDVIACLIATLLYIDTHAEGVFFGTLRANCAASDDADDADEHEPRHVPLLPSSSAVSPPPPPLGPPSVVIALTARKLGVIACLFCAITIGASWVIMVGGGSVPSTPLPCISDLWTQAPGNWISRWGVVSGAFYFYFYFYR